jgi:hypothetical protein
MQKVHKEYCNNYINMYIKYEVKIFNSNFYDNNISKYKNIFFWMLIKRKYK